MKPLNNLALSQIQRRLDSITKLKDKTNVKPGWIHFMRHSLGMTLKNLANAVGVATPTIAQLEQRESTGKITLDKLRKTAEAMECELIYAFVPKEDIKSIIRGSAFKKAKRIILRADTHMTLEDQTVKEDINERIERLAEKLIEKGDVW